MLFIAPSVMADIYGKIKIVYGRCMSLRMDGARKIRKPRRDVAEQFLNLPEQEDERVIFDPDTELTDERVQKIINHLIELKKSPRWKYGELAFITNAASIFPQIREKLPLDFFSEEIFQGVKNSIGSVDSRWDNSGLLLFLEKFYPHRSQEFAAQKRNNGYSKRRNERFSIQRCFSF